MTKENIVTLTASPSEGTEAKRNKKTQLLSALLSASALGVFLEGCSSSSGGGGGGNPDPVTPDPVSSVTGDGSEGNPYLATSAADSFTGSGSRDWVSYAGSNAGVNINLDSTATVSGGWAAGDNLRFIDNLIGSRFADTLTGDRTINSFEGGKGDDALTGGNDTDTYLFNAGDGTDMVIDNGGTIVFEQGANNDYAGATYALSNGDLKLTVAKGSETLNIIDFSEIPYDYAFYTRSGGSYTKIPESSLTLPVRQGSESNPYSATAGVDRFSGTGIYDWVSYAGSNSRVIVNLRDDPATVSEGWAEGDTLSGINNLIGSNHGDFFYGNSGDNIFRGGLGDDWLNGGAGDDTLEGGAGEDTANYSYSDEGVRVDLTLTTAQQDFETNSFGFARSQGGDAVGDILTGIENIRGSGEADWLTGDNNDNLFYGSYGNDRLEGGGGTDTYLFRRYEGTDTVVDNGGNIIFEPIGDDDYAGAIYTFTRPDATGEAVTLTVTKGSNTLNVIKFTSDPSSYTFYIRSVRSGNEIPASMLVVPPRVVGDGSESNPYLATAATDSFTGSGSRDWVSYAGSNAGVTIDLDSTATVSGGWAAGDNLRYIDNLIGSRYADTLTGDSGVNTLRGGAGNDILDGEGGRDILEGGAGQDDYIFSRNSGDDEIRNDPDGGRLLFRGHSPTSDSFYPALDSNDLDSNFNVIFVAGSTEITIIDGGANDAYQHGSYSVHYGTTDELLGNLYVGSNSLGDTLTGTSTRDILAGFGGNDKLYGLGGVDNLDGGAGNDQLYGGANTDYMRGGIGNDLLDGGGGTDFLFGEGGADTYRFDALGTDVDIIRGGTNDGAGNKLVFRAPSGVTYTDSNFNFARGNFDAQYQFTRTSSGDDLYTIVFTGSTSNPNIRSAIYVEDYFTLSSSAYTIYRTGYNSDSDGTIVSTAPAETS